MLCQVWVGAPYVSVSFFSFLSAWNFWDIRQHFFHWVSFWLWLGNGTWTVVAMFVDFIAEIYQVILSVETVMKSDPFVGVVGCSCWSSLVVIFLFPILSSLSSLVRGPYLMAFSYWSKRLINGQWFRHQDNFSLPIQNLIISSYLEIFPGKYRRDLVDERIECRSDAGFGEILPKVIDFGNSK